MHAELWTPVGPLAVQPYPATQPFKRTHALSSASSKEWTDPESEGDLKRERGFCPKLE